MLCSHYHAAMSQAEREEVQANWTHDRMHIIVATIAFGMGARVRCCCASLVLHEACPCVTNGVAHLCRRHQQAGPCASSCTSPCPNRWRATTR